ncbi:rhodanese-like domain-containing protein [Uliginosibacterium sp. H1]|uniref:rhodanese-like domain-containing protein n=1 Tax=Uliginosibacterium sp. H1 TaxID=3114757 RepID=UPI002E18CBE2|nr:rhodanese-like domain-containing protein [Uliginosibacterium sp. H1]
MTRKAGPATLRQWLNDGAELALIDVREPGQFGEGHAFFAINLPYSRLEVDAPARLPRRDVRIVLIDADDTNGGVAERAASRLHEAGYTDISVLEGGAAAWPQSGCALFKGVNLPSKTFGELVEQVCHTPHLSAAELQQRLQDKAPLLLVDGRTPAEHRKMAIPGALPVPNGELALRVLALLSDKQTPVVVHCAGRTRSIIGAQTLRHVGLPNPVIALENGTQGWRLAGLELEHDSPREIPDIELTATHKAQREGAHRYAQRAGVAFLDATAAQAWLDDPTRSSYAFDIRTADEYAAGTLPGAHHAPGGQLVQATDQYVAVRPARILVLDDEGIRAPTVAAWLSQLGFEAAVVEGGIRADLRLPTITPPALPVAPTRAQASTLRELAQAGTPILDLRPSLNYRADHLAGTQWTTRARIRSHAAETVVLIADDEVLAALAARDLQEAGTKTVLLADWQTARDSGLPREATPDSPSDAEAIDYLFFVHDRHDGNLDAARRYLAWETGLLAQCTEDELGVFRPLPQA